LRIRKKKKKKKRKKRKKRKKKAQKAAQRRQSRSLKADRDRKKSNKMHPHGQSEGKIRRKGGGNEE
jgi:hypothetical protein